MHGRPISGEEFDRMVAAVPKVVADEARAAAWEWFLRGLYWSGFRIGEAMVLSWDKGSDIFVDMHSAMPVAIIRPEGQKNRKAETLPLAPEFGTLLKAVPEADRSGFVFKPLTGIGTRATRSYAIRAVSSFGEVAGIKTWTNPRTKETKFATAHDLRRAFGTRWANRVMPKFLQQMMRHSTIQTTMKYYVGRDANETSKVIYAAFAQSQNVNTSVNSAGFEEPANRT